MALACVHLRELNGNVSDDDSYMMTKFILLRCLIYREREREGESAREREERGGGERDKGRKGKRVGEER